MPPKKIKGLKKKQLKPGVTYKAYSPKGYRIKGTADLIPGTALARSFKVGENKEIEPDYEGETDIYWDGQEVQTNKRGQALYVCTYGDVWPENQLEFVEVKEGEEEE